MKPPPFAYHRPTTLEEALDRLATDEGAVPLSGGQSLVPLLNMRLARPATVVDLSSIPGLDSITSDEGSVTIGGKVTHAALERHAWPAGFEALIEGVKRIGYPAIRHKGTVGGSVAHADPAAELPCLLVAFDAEIGLASSSGNRTVPADDFFVGYYETARRHDEIVTSVTIRIPPGLRSGFAEVSRRTGDFALALAAVATWDSTDGRQARVVVGGLDVRPRRIPELEQRLASGASLEDALADGVLARHVSPSSDIHASADYRLEVGAEMVRRAAQEVTA